MNKKVLIVDDEPSLRSALNKKLSFEGYEVIEASSGEECLSQMMEHKPGLVLLDILMPEMDGIEVLKKIRSNPAIAGTEVVVLTNKDDVKTLADVLSHKTFSFIAKADTSLDKVVELVKERLK